MVAYPVAFAVTLPFDTEATFEFEEYQPTPLAEAVRVYELPRVMWRAVEEMPVFTPVFIETVAVAVSPKADADTVTVPAALAVRIPFEFISAILAFEVDHVAEPAPVSVKA